MNLRMRASRDATKARPSASWSPVTDITPLKQTEVATRYHRFSQKAGRMGERSRESEQKQKGG
jgi:hypothetical protein